MSARGGGGRGRGSGGAKGGKGRGRGGKGKGKGQAGGTASGATDEDTPEAGVVFAGAASTTEASSVETTSKIQGRGLFKCDECGNKWTSPKACSGVAEYCRAMNCTAMDRQKGTFPFRIVAGA